jgi:hypothetical protein
MINILDKTLIFIRKIKPLKKITSFLKIKKLGSVVAKHVRLWILRQEFESPPSYFSFKKDIKA